MSDDFFIEMPRLSGELLNKARIGVGQAAMQLMADASIELPTTPHKTGALRGSGSVFVGKKMEGKSPDPKGIGTPATEYREGEDEGEVIVGVAGFNRDYALKVHEGVHMRFSQPGAGAKFLEKKLSNVGRYTKIIVNRMK